MNASKNLLLVGAVLDQETDDWWALEYLLSHMPCAPKMPVYCANKLPTEIKSKGVMERVSGETLNLWRSNAVQMQNRFAKVYGDHLDFRFWDNVEFNAKAVSNQLKDLRYPSTGRSPVHFPSNHSANASTVKNVLFVGARLSPSDLIPELNKVIKNMRTPLHFIVISGNPFNVKDHKDKNFVATDDYVANMEKAIRQIDCNCTVLAVNVPTPPAVKAMFGPFTQNSAIGMQPLAPTNFEKDTIKDMRKLMVGTQNNTNTNFTKFRNMMSGLETSNLGAAAFQATQNNNKLTELRKWGKKSANDLIRNTNGIGKYFGGSPPKAWHYRLQSALSAYHTPYAAGVVSDAANAAAALMKMHKLVELNKNKVAINNKVVIHVLGKEAAEFFVMALAQDGNKPQNGNSTLRPTGPRTNTGAMAVNGVNGVNFNGAQKLNIHKNGRGVAAKTGNSANGRATARANNGSVTNGIPRNVMPASRKRSFFSQGVTAAKSLRNGITGAGARRRRTANEAQVATNLAGWGEYH